MAIDTVRLRSPYITECMANKIEKYCTMRQGINLMSGDIAYQITTGFLEGSYDSRISLKVEREEWVKIGCSVPMRIKTRPFLVVECSVHKILLGHNVYGGSDDFLSCMNFLITFISNFLQVEFPFCFRKWKVERIDLAEVYDLGSFEAVQEYFKGLNASDYPRRTVSRYGLSGIYASGSTTALKFYHKGPEFNKHDRKRLEKVYSDEAVLLSTVTHDGEEYAYFEKVKDKHKRLNDLHDIANRILRVEVEIKSRKLQDIYGDLPYIGQIDMNKLYDVYDREVCRFLKEGVSDMEIVRNAHDVERRLYSEYGTRLAGSLVGTWYMLTTLGEDSVKKRMKKANYYKHLKLLREAGVSWTGTDVVLKSSSLIPAGFSPIRTDSRRLVGECKEVKKRLMQYRVIKRVA